MPSVARRDVGLATPEIRMRLTDHVHKLLADALNNQEIPWVQRCNDVVSSMPMNVLTQRPYRDINPLILSAASAKFGFHSKWWGTQGQWESLGGMVLGDKGVTTFRHVNRKQDGTFSVVKSHLVFNLDGVEGDLDRIRKNALWECSQFSWALTDRGFVNPKAEELINAIKASGGDIREVSGKEAAYYRDPKDYVVTPLKEQFDWGPGGPEAYYQVVCHELAHWSESRLLWLADPGRSLRDRYAIGELRADICSAYLCASFGIPPVANYAAHKKYMKDWLRIMADDKTMIIRTARAADAAAAFLLGFVAVAA